ncbi:MAG: hypothetical protein CL833_07015 [Crocinitomicaceae bacterium]|nr:hypothetical protein [Crocinitomicaceae bacterium]
MTIKEIHDFVLLLLNKHNTGYSTPAEIDSALDRAQMWYFNRLYGNIEEYQPGRPVPRVAYGMTQAVHDHLSPFKESAQQSSNSSGVITISNANYLHLLSISKSNKTIPILSEDEVAYRLDSQILAPSSTEPIAKISGDGVIQLYPKETHSNVDLDYLVRPAKPVFGFTQSGRTITYASGSSTQMEWNEPALNAIVMRAVNYLGVNLEDALAIQYSEGKIQQGT